MRKHWNHLRLAKCSVTDSKGKTRDNPTDFLKFTFMKGHKGQVVSDIIRA